MKYKNREAHLHCYTRGLDNMITEYGQLVALARSQGNQLGKRKLDRLQRLPQLAAAAILEIRRAGGEKLENPLKPVSDIRLFSGPQVPKATAKAKAHKRSLAELCGIADQSPSVVILADEELMAALEGGEKEQALNTLKLLRQEWETAKRESRPGLGKYPMQIGNAKKAARAAGASDEEIAAAK